MESERHWFKARLGQLDDRVQERWKTWAQRACLRYYLVEQGGETLLSAERSGEADAKSIQKMLRTIASHWKSNIPKFGREEWL